MNELIPFSFGISSIQRPLPPRQFGQGGVGVVTAWTPFAAWVSGTPRCWRSGVRATGPRPAERFRCGWTRLRGRGDEDRRPSRRARASAWRGMIPEAHTRQLFPFAQIGRENASVSCSVADASSDRPSRAMAYPNGANREIRSPRRRFAASAARVLAPMMRRRSPLIVRTCPRRPLSITRSSTSTPLLRRSMCISRCSWRRCSAGALRHCGDSPTATSSSRFVPRRVGRRSWALAPGNGLNCRHRGLSASLLRGLIGNPITPRRLSHSASNLLAAICGESSSAVSFGSRICNLSR
jgi:hypothetical protein